MLKKFVAVLAALLAATAFAAVDANTASQAELESIKGIGPVVSSTLIEERKKGEFKDWTDMITRVRGIGDRSAAAFSEGGLTVKGKPYPGPPVIEAPKKKKPVATEKKLKKTAAKSAAASAAKK
jgi:competence protein ComEA